MYRYNINGTLSYVELKDIINFMDTSHNSEYTFAVGKVIAIYKEILENIFGDNINYECASFGKISSKVLFKDEELSSKFSIPSNYEKFCVNNKYNVFCQLENGVVDEIYLNKSKITNSNQMKSVLNKLFEESNDIDEYKLYKLFERSKKSKNRNPNRLPLSKGVRHEVFKRDNYTCQECGAELGDIKPNGEKVKLEVDHIYPVSKGGTNDMNNLQTLCWDCNRNKSDAIW